MGSRECRADRRGPCCTTVGDTHARRRLDRPACLRRTIPQVVQAPIRHAHRGSHHGAASLGSGSPGRSSGRGQGPARRTGAAIRYALGSKKEPIGDSAPLWVAAARSRSPWSDDPAVLARHPGLGPDAGQAAIYDLNAISVEQPYDVPLLNIGLLPELPEGAADRADLPTVLFHDYSQVSFLANQWPSQATIWPSALESFFAGGLKRLVRSTDNVTDEPKCREYLTPLLNPDVPLRPMASLLIGVGLTAKVPELTGLVTDVLIAAIDDGRIDAAKLGESLRTVWRWEVRADPRYQPRAEQGPVLSRLRQGQPLGENARRRRPGFRAPCPCRRVCPGPGSG